MNKRTGFEIQGLTVVEVDKDMIVDDRLGKATTDRRGYFEIRYDKEDFQDISYDRKPDIILNTTERVIHKTKDKVSRVGWVE